MASHGRHGISAIVLGSETVKVLTLIAEPSEPVQPSPRLFIAPAHRAHLDCKRRCAWDQSKRDPRRLVQAQREYPRLIDREEAQGPEPLFRSAGGDGRNQDVHGRPLRVLHGPERDLRQTRQTGRYRTRPTRGRPREKKPALLRRRRSQPGEAE